MEIIEDECRDYKHRHLTGYFRDGVRRIDLVLVAKDTKIEEVEITKMNFLMNVMNGCLELEIEKGVLPQHKHLTFIKIHAPPHIIKHFGFYFDVQKYFKLNHLDRIKENVKDERDQIKMIRSDYPEPKNYSTHERSVVVYKILQSVTFGEYQNYIGINKLLKNKVFLDLYPLHDGPYFFVQKQKLTTCTGRQALMINWVNKRNLYRFQPIHLIREYLGERVAYLFAFYEYFNIMMFFAAVAGIIIAICNSLFLESRIKIILAGYNEEHVYDYPGLNKQTVPHTDFPVCPKCKDFVGCPFRNMKEYGREVTIKTLLDCPWNFFLSLFVVILGILTYLFWRRKESYLNWLWEIHVGDTMSMRRPEYNDKPEPVQKGICKNLLTKAKSRFSDIWRGFQEVIVILFFLSLYVFLVLPALIMFMLKLFNRYRYVEEEFADHIERPFHATSMTMFPTAVVNGIVIIIMERMWRHAARWLTIHANPRTERQFENAYTTNLFTYCFIINFGLLFFVAFVKGTLYTKPKDMSAWKRSLQMGMLNCGMLPCLEEIFILYVATYRCKLYFQEFLSMLEAWHNKTDVPKPTEEEYGEVPCWEREYPLRPITEDFFMRKYNDIMIEYTACMLFVLVFPLAPYVVFWVNVYRIRSLAKQVLIHSRRPLVLQTWGLGPWRRILFAIPFIIAIMHSLHLIRNSQLLYRNFNERHFKHLPERRYFADFYLSLFNMTDMTHYGDMSDKGGSRYKIAEYIRKWDKQFGAVTGGDKVKNFYLKRKLINPHFCMFPGHYERVLFTSRAHQYVMDDSYSPEPAKYYLHWHEALFVLFYEAIVLLIAILLHYWIRPTSKFVKKIGYAEEYVKEYHHRALKDKPKAPETKPEEAEEQTGKAEDKK